MFANWNSYLYLWKRNDKLVVSIITLQESN